MELIDMNNPLVSVAIISYNQEKFITQTIDSILSQKCNFDYEIVIGEDYSSDSTLLICQSFAHQNPDKIRILKREENFGLIKNYLETISQCQGKYIAQCAGDDFWIDEQKLQKQIDFLEANPEYGMVHTNFNVLNENSHEVFENNAPRNIGWIFDSLLIENQIGALTAVFRKELFLSALNDGVFNQSLLMEDYPFWLYIAKKNKIGYINDITATWRLNAESLSNSTNHKKRYLFEESKINVRKYFAEKYNCLEEIQENLIKDNKWLLRGAYEFGMLKQGKKAYQFLRKNKKTNLRDFLFFLSLHFPILIKIFRFFKTDIAKK